MIPMDNNIAAFWQSRMSVAGKPAAFPNLTDLNALARQVRMGYGRGRPPASPVPATSAAQSSRDENSHETY